MFLLMLLADTAPLVRPDGARLTAGVRCYTLMRDGKPLGQEYQRIAATRAGRARAWDIVIHQKLAGGAFDLRDHFVVDARDLRPIAFDSRKSGVEHVRLTYAADRITGWKTGKAGREPVDVALTGPVWEGDLWGPAFGALPLAAGRRFDLPFYQYDKGLGRFSVAVDGEESVSGRPAWRILAGTDPARSSTYLIDRDNGTTLGVRAGPFTTVAGGDCTGLG